MNIKLSFAASNINQHWNPKMNKTLIIILAVIFTGLIMGCKDTNSGTSNDKTNLEEFQLIDNQIASGHDLDSGAEIRVPAEWEPHAATWIQWPSPWEVKMRPAFADSINVIQVYEPVNLLISSEAEKVEAMKFLSDQGVPDTNITWHIVPVDSAWMRDNGPIYVTDGTDIWIHNWKFDAWGGNFGNDVPYQNDNRVPTYVGEYLGMAVEDHQDYVLEKGNLESNGAGILVLGWDCQDDRNPGMTRNEHMAILKDAFGATQILWAYGHWPEEATTGHIDATARFVDKNTLVIADYESPIDFDGLAAEAETIGLNVVRYQGDLNWLVGNGFILAMGEGSAYDEKSKHQLELLFPGRDVYLIDGRTIADAGGGIHCITNDQPAFDN
jgi:agmatine deiminase